MTRELLVRRNQSHVIPDLIRSRLPRNWARLQKSRQGKSDQEQPAEKDFRPTARELFCIVAEPAYIAGPHVIRHATCLLGHQLGHCGDVLVVLVPQGVGRLPKRMANMRQLFGNSFLLSGGPGRPVPETARLLGSLIPLLSLLCARRFQQRPF